MILGVGPPTTELCLHSPMRTVQNTAPHMMLKILAKALPFHIDLRHIDTDSRSLKSYVENFGL